MAPAATISPARVPPTIVTLLLALCLALLLAACGGRPAPVQRPPVRLPPPDLNAPSGARIGDQLRQLNSDARLCHALLERADGLSVMRLADTREGPGCGLTNAARITRAPTPLAKPVPLTCPMIAGLYLWTREVVQPAARRHFGTGVQSIETFGSFACRNRNSQPGTRISEHATANALDVSGFVLADGRRVPVEAGWISPYATTRGFLREIHKGACRYFSVVLGPDADHFHRNHIHMDMGPWTKCQ